MNRSCEFCLRLVVMGCAVIAVPICAATVDGTAFLDRPLPPDLKLLIHAALPSNGKGPDMDPMVEIPSLRGAITILGTISGKKIVLSKDLGTWPDVETEHNWGMGIGFEKGEKVRELFERICFIAGLAWNYDVVSDTIQLDPQWKRDDSRGLPELIRIVGHTKPKPWTELTGSPTPNRVGGHSQNLDEWRIAFDALLSNPVNYSSAGTLRVYHDSHGHMEISPFPVINDFAGPIQDEHGNVEILVLNEQISGTNKDSAGDLAYYLFDEQGKFLKGGIYAVADGAQSGIVKVALQDKRTVVIYVGYGSFKMSPDKLQLGLLNGDFVLLGSTDSKGKERGADETRNSLCQFSHMMQVNFIVDGR